MSGHLKGRGVFNKGKLQQQKNYSHGKEASLSKCQKEKDETRSTPYPMIGRVGYGKDKGRGFWGTCYNYGHSGRRFYECPQCISEGSSRTRVVGAHVVKGDTESIGSVSHQDELERGESLMMNMTFLKPTERED